MEESPDANWDEEKYLKKLRVCVIQGVAENRNNPVSVMEIINLFKSHNEFAPSVRKLGYNSIDDFFHRYPDKFTKFHNGWMVAPNSLSEKEKEHMTNVEQSQQKNNKRPAGRGSFVPRGGGRGGGFTGGFAARGGGFGARGGFNNVGNRPAYNNANSFAQNNRSNDFNNRGSNYPPPNYHNSNRDWNRDAQRDYNDQYGGTRDNGYQQNRDDRSRDYGSRRENDNYGPNYDYEQEKHFNDRRGDDRRYDNYDRHEPSHSYQPEPEPPRPSFGSGRSSAFSQPARAASPDYPPGLEPPKSGRLSPPPGLDGPWNASPPPPRFGSGRSDTTATSSTTADADAFTSDGKSAAGPHTKKLSYTEMAKAFLRRLHSVWPKKMEGMGIAEVCREYPKFARVFKANAAEIESHMKKALTKLEKPLYQQFFHKETTEDGKEYYTFRAGHPAGATMEEQAVMGVPMIANFLKRRPQDNTTKVLAEVLGIETRGGLSAGWLILEYVRHRTNEFRTEKLASSNYAITVLPEAIFERWIPARSEELEAWEDEEEEEEGQQEGESPNLFDGLRMLEAAQGLMAEVAQEAPNYYSCEHEPLSTIFEQEDYRGPDSFPSSFKVRVSRFIDLNRFFIQTENDYEEYKRLKRNMTDFYETQDIAPLRRVAEGQKVAFWRQRGNEEEFLRGTVTVVVRKRARIDIVDEGGHIWCYKCDIFPLDDYYSRLPALATRCSVGDFTLRDDCMEHEFDVVENNFEEDIASSKYIDAKIVRTEKPSLIVDLRVEMVDGEVIEAPRCFSRMIHLLD